MIAVRTCVGCGGRTGKVGLQRFVRDGQSLRLDHAQRAPGRGAYLHSQLECVRRFTRAKGAVRSLRWTPSTSQRAELAAEVEGMIVGPK